MAVPANTAQTYQSSVIAEDLSKIAEMIAPTETPFLTAIRKGTTVSTHPEWVTVDLASASDTNAEIEGNDVTADAMTEGVRLSNYTQISDKVAQVSSTREIVDESGDLNRMSKQLALKTQELKRDIEKTLLSNKVASAGSASTARTSASFASFLQTNVSRGTSGVNPVLSGTTSGYPDTAAVDGTQRALTEALLKTVLALAWTNGGDPSLVFVGSANKQLISAFTGNATTFREMDSRKIVAAVDIYVGDFGEVQIVPSRLMRARDALVVTPDKVEIAYLQKMRQEPLAKTGHSEKRMVTCEWVCKVLNERAHGIVADLS
ncbi:MAG: head protein [Paucimonas sp.]|jgi:hypothetical protein|nr:head protein [Paucimonas sp.]